MQSCCGQSVLWRSAVIGDGDGNSDDGVRRASSDPARPSLRMSTTGQITFPHAPPIHLDVKSPTRSSAEPSVAGSAKRARRPFSVNLPAQEPGPRPQIVGDHPSMSALAMMHELTRIPAAPRFKLSRCAADAAAIGFRVVWWFGVSVWDTRKVSVLLYPGKTHRLIHTLGPSADRCATLSAPAGIRPEDPRRPETAKPLPRSMDRPHSDRRAYF